MANVLSHGFKKRSFSAVFDTVRHTDEYIVKCDPGVTQKQVLAYFRDLSIAPGLLGDSAMVCADITGSASVLDGQLWSVTARYESVAFPTHGLGGVATPLDEPWVVRFGKTTLSQVVSKCFARWVDKQDSPPSPGTEAGVPIVNTVGDPFDPPLMQDTFLPTIELNKNLSTAAFTSLLGAWLDDTVNASAITVAGNPIPKWGGKINIEGGTATYVNPSNGNLVTYVQARIIVTIHPQTWVRFVLNAGFRIKDSDSGKVVRIKEPGYGQKRADVPTKLDENGAVIDSEDPDDAVWLAFMTYRATSWSPANLPSSLGSLG